VVLFIDKITDKDRAWLRSYCPKLKIIEGDPLIIVGTLSFDMFYDGNNSQYVLNPEGNPQPENMRIRDEYEIDITFKGSDFSSLPQVRETGGRIRNIIEKRKLAPKDLHLYSESGPACLCSPLDEEKHLPKGFCISDYFSTLVIPFFYAQSYYEKYNKWAPWGDYSHGALGILESYATNENSKTLTQKCIQLIKRDNKWAIYNKLLESNDDLKEHLPCICGLPIKFGYCHPLACSGLLKLKNDIK